jgi:hypothetical protein
MVRASTEACNLDTKISILPSANLVEIYCLQAGEPFCSIFSSEFVDLVVSVYLFL